MYKIAVALIFALFAFSCNQSPRGDNAAATPAVAEAEVIAATIPELLASPEEYRDKEVAISGMVTHVCRHGGQKCFVVAEDGETQIRLVPGGDIDEFKIDMEGSSVAFRGVFRILNAAEAEEHLEDHESQEHHDQEMAHTQAEKADYFIEASEFKEVSL